MSLKANIYFIQSFSSKYEPQSSKLKVEKSHEITQLSGAKFQIGPESLHTMHIFLHFLPILMDFKKSIKAFYYT